MLNSFVESFLPLFVAINLPGILPIYIGITEGLPASQRRRTLIQALASAFGVAALILVAGKYIFQLMGITVNDLRVGGGLILLVLSITDLIFADFKRRAPGSEGDGAPAAAIVPLGIPLIIGPAAITTILVSQQAFGYLITGATLVANLVLVFAALSAGPLIVKTLGKNTSVAIGKVASLFLAAIAVAMIRAGIRGFLGA